MGRDSHGAAKGNLSHEIKFFSSKDSGGDVAHVACVGDIDTGFALRRIAYFLNG